MCVCVYVCVCVCVCVFSIDTVPFVLFGSNTSRQNVVRCRRQLQQSSDVTLCDTALPASHMVSLFISRGQFVRLTWSVWSDFIQISLLLAEL